MGNASASVSRAEVIRNLYNQNKTEELYKRHISGNNGPSSQIPESFATHGVASSKMIDSLASQVGEALGASFFDKRLQLLGQSAV